MKNIFISPNLNGHYRKYFEVLSDPERGDSLAQCSTIGQLFRVLAPLGGDRVRVTFLGGDFQIWLVFWSCIFGYRKRCSLIVYYTHFQNRSPKRHLKMGSFRLLRRLGVKVFLLEGCESGNPGFEGLPDLIDRKTETTELEPVATDDTTIDSNIVFLLFGYIDGRKCVREMIEALDIYASGHSTSQIEFRIIGNWNAKYFEGLTSLIGQTRPYAIVIRDEYVDEDELVREIVDASCVFAIYRNHVGSSSVVNLAVAYRKCVIYRPIGYLEGFADALAFNCLPRSVSAYGIVSAIEKLQAAGFRPNYSVEKAECYIALRTPEKFKRKFDGQA